MSDTPTVDLAAMLQDLYRNVSARFQGIEGFLVAIGNQMQGFGSDLKTLDHNGASGIAMLDRKVEGLEEVLMLAGQARAGLLPRHKLIRDLTEVEFKVYSQWGEDGIIEWIVAHLPGIPRTFVEFGVEDFSEANCRFLLRNRGWKGLVMDGHEGNMTLLRNRPIVWQYDLSAVQAFVTAENIDDLLRDNGFTGQIGLLSVDIDGNDYWVWDRIEAIDPAIVVCEMNGVLGDRYPITVPYNPYFERLKGHHSGQYFGASVAALRHLGEKKGYEFLGTNSRGVNAFFVRKDLADNILPYIEDRRAYPSFHRDSRSKQGSLTFLAGLDRFEAIREMPVVDVTTGATMRLEELDQPYSADWLAKMAYI